MRALIGDSAFKTVFIEDKHNVFELVGLEYLQDLDCPGKALVILEAALLSRSIKNKNRLASIALESTERAMMY